MLCITGSPWKAEANNWLFIYRRRLVINFNSVCRWSTCTASWALHLTVYRILPKHSWTLSTANWKQMLLWAGGCNKQVAGRGRCIWHITDGEFLFIVTFLVLCENRHYHYRSTVDWPLYYAIACVHVCSCVTQALYTRALCLGDRDEPTPQAQQAHFFACEDSGTSRCSSVTHQTENTLLARVWTAR